MAAHPGRERQDLIDAMSRLAAQALTLRDAFHEPEFKRVLDNIATDLGIFDRMLPERDDLLATLVAVKAGEIEHWRGVLHAYPPRGPQIVGS